MRDPVDELEVELSEESDDGGVGGGGVEVAREGNDGGGGVLREKQVLRESG